jgi:diaminopimelate decarboxylase
MVDLKQIVNEELDRYAGPVLIFDKARIRANLTCLVESLGGDAGRVLFAVKSFPLPEILTMAWEVGVGFEVSNQREYQLLPRELSGRTVSLNSPLREGPSGFLEFGNRLNIHLDAAPDRYIGPLPSGSSFCLRLSHKSLPVDPSLLIERDRPSRFGVPWDSFLAAAPLFQQGILRGVHVHNGSEVNTAAFYRAALKLIINTSQEHGIPLRYVNLGGGFHSIAQAELEQLLNDLHTTAGELSVFIEPGHVLCREAGFLLSKVHEVRPFGGGRYHVTVDASYDCHAKWSHPSWGLPVDLDIVKLPHREIPAPRPGFQILRITGSSCYEHDQLGIFCLPERSPTPPLKPGDPIVLSNINGYSYAWNTGFNGILPARLRLV